MVILAVKKNQLECITDKAVRSRVIQEIAHGGVALKDK